MEDDLIREEVIEDIINNQVIEIEDKRHEMLEELPGPPDPAF